MDFDPDKKSLSRRQFLKSASALSIGLSFGPLSTLVSKLEAATDETMKTRPIPSTGEPLPIVGLGTWQQFDVNSDPAYLNPLSRVLRNLFKLNGSVIDTSPMYGRAESVLGELLNSLDARDKVFLATKVWTSGRRGGINQMESSMEKLGVNTVDLMQVHNLVDWQTHLETLEDWKEAERIRYIGVTHYTQSAFSELEQIMTNESIDFVQLPYSIGFREAEERLLPLAEDQEIAVIVNRPFEAGGLFRGIRGKSLPEWAEKIDCNSWAQFFLKFILGHPAVTTVIPGTSNPQHMLDNARAGTSPIPSQKQRERMYRHWKSIR